MWTHCCTSLSKKRVHSVPVREIQLALIQVFKKWGKPKSIQVDNGLPFVNPPTDAPTPIFLWLIGLGIKMIRTRPYRPTDNAKVERMQGLTRKWAEPKKCVHIAELNTALKRVCKLQLEEYPCDRYNGKTRIEQFPTLLNGGTTYKNKDFYFDKVLTFLAKSSWIRKSSAKGLVSFIGKTWNISITYRHQYVYVELDSSTNEWVISTQAKEEIKRFENTQITKKRLKNLSKKVS